MRKDIHGIDRLLLVQRKEPDRPPVATVAVIIAAVAAPAAGEGDGIGAVSVGLPGEEEKRVPAGAGENGRADEGGPTALLFRRSAAEVYEELKEKVEVVETLHDTLYGMREVIIRDLNRFWRQASD